MAKIQKYLISAVLCPAKVGQMLPPPRFDVALTEKTQQCQQSALSVKHYSTDMKYELEA